LTDLGFGYLVLKEFRARSVATDAVGQVLDRVLTLCKERGVLTARGKQRTDST
jgi:hypothetical protein